MWRFNLAAAGPRAQGGSWRDQRSCSQGKDSWGSCRGRLGRKRMESFWAVQGRINESAVGGERRSCPSIHAWERAFHSSSNPLRFRSPRPLELTMTPSLCPHSIPYHSEQRDLLLALGVKHPAGEDRLVPGQRTRQEYFGEGLSFLLAIPL